MLTVGLATAADVNATSNDTQINDTPQITSKTFTNLAEEIDNAKAGSTLVIEGKYKYDASTDQKYQKGITISKNIKIIGKGNCEIDGAGKARCLKINSKVTLKDITFKNGYLKQGNGAAIYMSSNSQLKVYNCKFTNNIVYNGNGAAIYSGENTILKIYDSKFEKNNAIRKTSAKWPNYKKGMGGAITINKGSKLTLSKCTFKSNKAYLSIVLVISYNHNKIKTSQAYVKDCLFEKNTAKNHGTFYLDEYGKGKFINCIFRNNNAKKFATLVLDASKYVLVKNCKFIKNSGTYGGAIDLFKFKKAVTHVSIIGCQFIKNKATKAGGAIFSEQAKLTLKNCKFIKNKAHISGGAVEIRKGKVKLSKLLFKQNTAKYGGALLVKDLKKIKIPKCKFIKNNAKKGKKILGIYHHELYNIKIIK